MKKRCAVNDKQIANRSKAEEIKIVISYEAYGNGLCKMWFLCSIVMIRVTMSKVTMSKVTMGGNYGH